MFDPSEHPHRRYNPLIGEYVLVSPHRNKRPWRGQVEKTAPDERPSYDPTCYLCPGNERAGGAVNPAYSSTFVFANDFAALLPQIPSVPSSHPLLRTAPVTGVCRVVCFSPQHNLTLPEMETADIGQVIDVWTAQVKELGKLYQWVQIFENKGAMMGCSNPHPHGQIWGLTALPNEPTKEDRQQQVYWEREQRPLLLDYALLEQERQERVVMQNDHWLVVVPYWAMWPFETLLLPRRHVLRLPDLDKTERAALAAILKQLLIKYDNLFETPFPYSMGWHGAPTGDRLATVCRHWQLHAHFYPPLLRSATIKKFMVGFEMLGEGQRDLTAEQAAARLRELPSIHYKQRG